MLNFSRTEVTMQSPRYALGLDQPLLRGSQGRSGPAPASPSGLCWDRESGAVCGRRRLHPRSWSRGALGSGPSACSPHALGSGGSVSQPGQRRAPGCPQVSCPVLAHPPSSVSVHMSTPTPVQSPGGQAIAPGPSSGQVMASVPSQSLRAGQAPRTPSPGSLSPPRGQQAAAGRGAAFALSCTRLSPWASAGPCSPMCFASDVREGAGCLLGPRRGGARALSTCALSAGMNRPAGLADWFPEDAGPVWLPRWFVAPRARVPGASAPCAPWSVVVPAGSLGHPVALEFLEGADTGAQEQSRGQRWRWPVGGPWATAPRASVLTGLGCGSHL